MEKPALSILLPGEIAVDGFCGGGGASEGIKMAIGRDPDVAINHDPEAVVMHQANHPGTKHYCQSIYRVDPEDVVREFRAPIGLAWFSPDCTHHSKARGGKPKQKHIRDLAWIVPHWAERAVWEGKRPRIIFIENVEEFQDWGPLLEDGKACQLSKGLEFKRWVKALKKLGYDVAWKELRACDYGAPTIRKRLFVVARCDGQPIVFPAPTHGPNRAQPYRTAAECIDWSNLGSSIFLSKEQGKKVRAKRPLADATLRRVAHGVSKYVVKAKKPFIVNLTHHGAERNEPTDEPFKTITGANRGEKALVQPFLAGCGGRAGQSEPRPADKPYHTTTAKADTCLVAPLLAGAGGPIYSGKPKSADEPLNTIVKENHTAVVSPMLASLNSSKSEGDHRCHDAREPVNTIMTDPRHALVGALLTEHANASSPRSFPADEPMRTQCAQVKGGHFVLCAAHLAQHNNHGEGVPNVGRDAEEPLSTITASGAQQGIVASSLVKLRGTCQHGQPSDEPLATISAEGQHLMHTAAMLTEYYGNEKDGMGVNEPIHTITSQDRFGLVQNHIVCEQLQEAQCGRARAVADLMREHGQWDDREFVTVDLNGVTYVIADIYIRMLMRRELFNAQGFRPDYIIDPIFEGKPMTNTASVRMCGNSVSPWPACMLILANPAVPPHLAEAAE